MYRGGLGQRMPSEDPWQKRHIYSRFRCGYEAGAAHEGKLCGTPVRAGAKNRSSQSKPVLRDTEDTDLGDPSRS